MLPVYAVDVVEPEIDRGETAPCWSPTYETPTESAGYPVELTGVSRAGAGGSVEDGLADWASSAKERQSRRPSTYVFSNDLLQRT
jgi:hypothetical protein